MEPVGLPVNSPIHRSKSYYLRSSKPAGRASLHRHWNSTKPACTGSPMLFSSNGYQLVVMPMLTAESQNKLKHKSQRRKPSQTDTEPESEATEQVLQKPPTATAETANSGHQRHTTGIHSVLKVAT